MEQGESPDGAGAPRLLTPTTMVSLLLAAGALLVAIAVLVGWLYTRAYYREFGIEPSVLSFSPYDYALRAKLGLREILMAGVSGLLGFSLAFAARLVPESHPLRRYLGPSVSDAERTTQTVMQLVFLAWVVGFGLADWFIIKSGAYLWMLALLMTIWTMQVTIWFLARRREYFFLGAASLVVVVALLVLWVPEEQGEADGRRDHNHLDRFPAVSLVVAEELGLPQHEVTEPFHRYGPYRLVLYNNGMYYLVSEDEPDETLVVPEGPITHLQIHTKR